MEEQIVTKKMRRQTEELLRLLCQYAEENGKQDIACRCMAEIQRLISKAAFEARQP